LHLFQLFLYCLVSFFTFPIIFSVFLLSYPGYIINLRSTFYSFNLITGQTEDYSVFCCIMIRAVHFNEPGNLVSGDGSCLWWFLGISSLHSSQCREKGVLFGLLRSDQRMSVSQLVSHSFCETVIGSDFQKLNLSKWFSLDYISAGIRNCTWAQPKVTGLKKLQALSTMPKHWRCAEMSVTVVYGRGKRSQESIMDDNLAVLW